jgi:hypothetical protein
MRDSVNCTNRAGRVGAESPKTRQHSPEIREKGHSTPPAIPRRLPGLSEQTLQGREGYRPRRTRGNDIAKRGINIR